MPDKTHNDRNGAVSSGTVNEYISPMGGHKTIVVIDSGMTGIKFIPLDHGQITDVAKNFPVGSRVAYYWSERDNHYVFLEPEAI